MAKKPSKRLNISLPDIWVGLPLVMMVAIIIAAVVMTWKAHEWVDSNINEIARDRITYTQCKEFHKDIQIWLLHVEAINPGLKLPEFPEMPPRDQNTP